jgi:hypothetical protein
MIDLTNETFTLESEIHFQIGRKGRKQIRAGHETPAIETAGAVSRLARLLALAIRFQGFLRAGEVRDYADLARLGHVTRARMTQIMNLLNLAPDIQEQILFMSPTAKTREAVAERRIRSIAAAPDWRKQRRLWRELNGPLRPSLSARHAKN